MRKTLCLQALLLLFLNSCLIAQKGIGTCRFQFDSQGKTITVSYEVNLVYSDGSKNRMANTASAIKVDENKAIQHLQIRVFDPVETTKEEVPSPADKVLPLRKKTSFTVSSAPEMINIREGLFTAPGTLPELLNNKRDVSFIFNYQPKPGINALPSSESITLGLKASVKGMKEDSELCLIKVGIEFSNPEKEEEAFWRAQNERALEASRRNSNAEAKHYLDYLEKYRDGKHAPDAERGLIAFYSKRFDEAYDDVDKLDAFIRKFPESNDFGDFIRKAQDRLNHLRERRADTPCPDEDKLWGKIKRDGNINDLNTYLQDCKNGRHRREAQEKLKQRIIECDELFERAETNQDASSFEQYLDDCIGHDARKMQAVRNFLSGEANPFGEKGGEIENPGGTDPGAGEKKTSPTMPDVEGLPDNNGSKDTIGLTWALVGLVVIGILWFIATEKPMRKG